MVLLEPLEPFDFCVSDDRTDTSDAVGCSVMTFRAGFLVRDVRVVGIVGVGECCYLSLSPDFPYNQMACVFPLHAPNDSIAVVIGVLRVASVVQLQCCTMMTG